MCADPRRAKGRRKFAMSMRLITLAYDVAGKAHEGQRRRGNGEPYVNHPIRVAKTVSEAGGDEEQVIAAVLHDTVEDGSLTLQDIEDKFGSGIRHLVDGCTDDSSIAQLPLKERKQAQAEKFRKSDVRTQLIKLADQDDNLQSLLETLDGRKTNYAMSYAECALMVAQACGQACPALLQRAEHTYERIVEELKSREEACPAM